MGVCVWVGGRWGGRDFPLNHKADGADVSGRSQSQRGHVYPATAWTSRDSSPSRSPLRIPLLLAHYQPRGEAVNICMYTAQLAPHQAAYCGKVQPGERAGF